MQHLHLIPFALLLSAFISCKDENLDSYEKSLEQWEKNSYHNYRYEFRLRCFCDNVTDWVEITVRNDMVFRVVNLDSGQVYENEWVRQRKEFRTIDDLFDLIRQAVDGSADDITATYDTLKGFPVKVHIDVDQESIDDEVGFEIRKVVVE